MLSYKVVALCISYLTFSASALPIKREVPQEHSHEPILTAVRTTLNLNNPDQIVDPVFALLGDAAAKQGAGKITVNIFCLLKGIQIVIKILVGSLMSPTSCRRPGLHQREGRRKRRWHDQRPYVPRR